MKKIITALMVVVLLVGGASSLQARTKYYRSTTNIPFVEMMLNMMVVMGILDKVPYDLMASNLQSRWLSPYGQYGQNRTYPGYLNRYNALSSPYSLWGVPGYGSRNNRLNRSASYPGRVGTPGYGFYGLPFSRNRYYQNSYSRNPLAIYPTVSPFSNSEREVPNEMKAQRDYENSWQAMSRASCADGPCDFDQSELTGLWVSEDGEMLGIRDEQFLWTDGVENYQTGLMDISPGYAVAHVDETGQKIVYQYRLEDDHLITRDRGGVVRHFWREFSMPSE